MTSLIPIGNAIIAVKALVDKSHLRGKGRKAFSLVEVVMAIGLVSFSMLIILGLLPVGLNNVRQSVVQIGQAGIAKQIRSDMEQLPLTGATDSIASLNGQIYYYTVQGQKTAVSTATSGYTGPPYFQATFSVAAATTAPGVAPQFSDFNTSAANVTVTVVYPYGSPNQQSYVFSLLEAGQ